MTACFFCGGEANEGKCGACGIASARADGTPSAACDRCGQGTLAAIELGDARGRQCNRCRGVFFSSEDWDGVVGAVRKGGKLALGNIVPPPPKETLTKEQASAVAACPSCRGSMERATFGKSTITIDVCAKHGLWLDGGEVVAVIEDVRRGTAS